MKRQAPRVLDQGPIGAATHFKVLSPIIMTNLAAYTAPGFAPPFVSINSDGDTVEIIVRSEGKKNGDCGDCASIKMNVQRFRELITSISL